MQDFPWLAHYQKGVPHEINPDRYRHIPDLLDTVAQEAPSRPIFTNMGSTLTAAEVKSLSEDLAAYFQSIPDLKKGDRVAIMMPNTLQYVVTVFAILKAGLVVVNVNPLYTSRELLHQLKDSGAKAIVIVENFARTFEAIQDASPVKHVVLTEIGDLFNPLKGALVNFVVKYVKKMTPKHSLNALSFRDALDFGRRNGYRPVEIANTDVALLQYTGGTTGVSKGAMLTHRNVLANVEQTGIWISTTFEKGREVAMCALPLYHIFSFTATLCFLHWQARSVLITNPRDMEGLVKEVKKWRFTIFTGVNTLFNALLNRTSFTSLPFNVKMTVAGGTQIQQSVAERWKAVTGNSILEAYGLTEASPGICGNLPDAPWDGSVGYPLPSTEVSIRGEGFKDLGVCEDKSHVEQFTGEICAKGPQVMLGYWEKPDETASVFRDGWLKTGDVGYMDATGKVTITDRKKDLILVSGFNVYPNEVEGVIASMPGVLEVGVVGVPSEKSGETVKAVIVRKDPTITKDDVRKFCRTQLTGYKVPREIVFVSQLPKTAVGKILRRDLKALADEG